MTTRIQVVFYSMYGHVYRLAEAVSEGAREVVGTEVSVYQVPELVPDDILEKTGAKAARTAFAHVPVAKPEKLADADAIIFGTPTRFGNMCAQMRNFLDQTGGLWMSGALVGKVGSVFTSTASQHGGQETDDHELPQHAPAPGHDHRRRAVFGAAAGGHDRDHRGDALRRFHDHCRRWVAAAYGERAGHRPLPR
jgi:multimeric flavodoxin WrbA